MEAIQQQQREVQLLQGRGMGEGSRAALNVRNEGGELIPTSDELRAVLVSGHRERILFGGCCGEVPRQAREALYGALATGRRAFGSHLSLCLRSEVIGKCCLRKWSMVKGMLFSDAQECVVQ